MPISTAQYQEMLARTSLKQATPSVGSPVARESDLHEDIINECTRRGWIAFHSRMDRRPTNQVGTPDFIIATDDGRTLYIECKRPGSKCTPAQNAMLAWLQKNHQKWAIVTSIQEFMEFVKQQPPYLSPETIASLCIDVACDYFDITREEMLSRARPARLCWPRHVAMTVAWELSGLSTNQLAPIFHRNDHVSILHAHRVVTSNVEVRKRADYVAVESRVKWKTRQAA